MLPVQIQPNAAKLTGQQMDNDQKTNCENNPRGFKGKKQRKIFNGQVSHLFLTQLSCFSQSWQSIAIEETSIWWCTWMLDFRQSLTAKDFHPSIEKNILTLKGKGNFTNMGMMTATEHAVGTFDYIWMSVWEGQSQRAALAADYSWWSQSDYYNHRQRRWRASERKRETRGKAWCSLFPRSQHKCLMTSFSPPQTNRCITDTHSSPRSTRSLRTPPFKDDASAH